MVVVDSNLGGGGPLTQIEKLTDHPCDDTWMGRDDTPMDCDDAWQASTCHAEGRATPRGIAWDPRMRDAGPRESREGWHDAQGVATHSRPKRCFGSEKRAKNKRPVIALRGKEKGRDKGSEIHRGDP